MSKEIYTDILGYYNIPRNHSKIKSIRKLIRDRFSKHYPSKTWEDLTEFEKRKFILVIMADKLLDKSNTPNDVRNKIVKDMDRTLFQANENLIAHNRRVNALTKIYNDSNATEEELKKTYLEFCDNLQEYYPEMAPPSFEEWEKGPSQIYGYVISKITEDNINFQKNESCVSTSITQSKIDHTILKCILSILKKEQYIEIDVESIKHCLDVTKDMDSFEDCILQTDYDPSSKIPKEKQELTISQNLEMMEAKRKLDENDFWKYTK